MSAVTDEYQADRGATDSKNWNEKAAATQTMETVLPSALTVQSEW